MNLLDDIVLDELGTAHSPSVVFDWREQLPTSDVGVPLAPSISLEELVLPQFPFLRKVADLSDADIADPIELDLFRLACLPHGIVPTSNVPRWFTEYLRYVKPHCDRIVEERHESFDITVAQTNARAFVKVCCKGLSTLEMGIAQKFMWLSIACFALVAEKRVSGSVLRPNEAFTRIPGFVQIGGDLAIKASDSIRTKFHFLHQLFELLPGQAVWFLAAWSLDNARNGEHDPRATHHSEPLPKPAASHEEICALDAKYEALREETRIAIEHLLAESAGKIMPSLDAKQALAAEVRERLHRVGLRIQCPRCKRPAALRASRAGGTGEGVFQFDHAPHGTHGGGKRGQNVLPPGLKVISASPDRRVKVSQNRKKKN